MPITGTALLVAVAISVSIWGVGATVRGAKKAAHSAAQKIHHKKPVSPK